MRDFVMTSTSLTEGHPDKLSDSISDAIVDAYLLRDQDARVSAECAVASGVVFLSVHVASEASVDLSQITRDVIAEAGYEDTDFSPDKVAILSSVSPHRRTSQAIGSQIESLNATVFGYACRHTPEMMPLPIALAHRLARRLSYVRREDERFAALHPDGQVQVAVRYGDRQPQRLETVMVFSALKTGERFAPVAEADVRSAVVAPVLAELDLPSADASIAVSLEKAETSGGPTWHGGLTGRKNQVDSYGGYCRHGGAALSGKDPWRIDRLGAYAARYAAKNIVASGLATECEVQLSYTMGKRMPLSVEIDSYNSGAKPDDVIADALSEIIDFSPAGLMERFKLAQVPAERGGRFFQDLAVFGHFGRTDLDLPWEHTDLAEQLRSA
ncbi:methionine adenosyltransferase [Dichotomicrobium thermohalophilum]|uniref:Methionine adenosyltransferase n=1 Tax=Dichotomicrobium thermohalophilum TaxID=933063 RepID=A0A397Q3X7_9HYPH|nr:methionine adenosyltransferase [Dichotomicrobium thermohalophilum]RIA55758.1 methionine adenosyltransferase [Dichotomicrobium thermohalophilum]